MYPQKVWLWFGDIKEAWETFLRILQNSGRTYPKKIGLSLSYSRMSPSYIIQKVFLRLENAAVSTSCFWLKQKDVETAAFSRFMTEKNV